MAINLNFSKLDKSLEAFARGDSKSRRSIAADIAAVAATAPEDVKASDLNRMIAEHVKASLESFKFAGTDRWSASKVGQYRTAFAQVAAIGLKSSDAAFTAVLGMHQAGGVTQEIAEAVEYAATLPEAEREDYIVTQAEAVKRVARDKREARKAQPKSDEDRMIDFLKWAWDESRRDLFAGYLDLYTHAQLPFQQPAEEDVIESELVDAA